MEIKIIEQICNIATSITIAGELQTRPLGYSVGSVAYHCHRRLLIMYSRYNCQSCDNPQILNTASGIYNMLRSMPLWLSPV